jgi:hypothetical protein
MDRLDRIDAILDRFARQIAENSRLIRELAEITRENSRRWEQLCREFGLPR